MRKNVQCLENISPPRFSRISYFRKVLRGTASPKTISKFITNQIFSFLDEEFLEHYLLRCKNSMELAKIVLERYFSLKAVLPEVYDSRNPNDEDIVQTMKAM